MKRAQLIVCEAGDLHACAVASALRSKGGDPILWHTSDFPSRATETALLDGSRSVLRLAGPDFELIDQEPRTVWLRRASHRLDSSVLHSDDVKFADSECRLFRQSLLRVLAPHSFWVNAPEAAARADYKIYQHRAALDAGLTVPATLYSNDPEQIRRFLRSHPEGVVYKLLGAFSWDDGQSLWGTCTSLLDEEALVADELLRATPGIYQVLVPKSHELRVTVMGRQVFAAKILSQQTVAGRLDWRRAYRELEMEPSELPAEITNRCFDLLSRLGLVFGCFDFVVTPEGEHVFLEVNEMGQFLFVELYTGQPLLDAFSDFLLAGVPDFRWDGKSTPIRYSDLEGEVFAAARRSLELHAPPEQPGVVEGAGEPSSQAEDAAGLLADSSRE
jgi:glutathione synthase/RimK-type ligase-like ATP-grasp enzyme